MKDGHLEAKDLMIGDLIRHFNGTPMKVTTIKSSDFACGVPSCWSYNNEYKPIPLTPEILEKNGFLKEVRGYVNKHTSDWFLMTYEDELNNQCMMVGGVEIILKYVHQLQHILRLCGLTELVDNFKI